MTVEQVKKTEEITNELIGRNEPVYAKESALGQAKNIKGLRAMFNEVCL